MVRYTLALLASLYMVGCTPTDGLRAAPEGAEPGTVRAFINPEAKPILEDLFRSACEDDPNNALVELPQDGLRCDFLIPPEGTAALILQYGGTLTNLPVGSIDQTFIPQDDDSLLLYVRQYLQVPREGRGPVVIVPENTPFLDDLRDSIEAGGGRTF